MSNYIFTPPKLIFNQIKCINVVTSLMKYCIILFTALLSVSKTYSQSVYEWPAAIVEMHYNNTGPDVNEYIEIHQYNEGRYFFPNGVQMFSEIRFYDNLGVLYKTLSVASMQQYFVTGHTFYYYNFPPGEDFADAGTIRIMNATNGGTILADYVYNAAGITENRYFDAPVLQPTRFFPVSENETTPIGVSLNFCGYYYNPDWTSYIMASSYGSYNACVILPVSLSSFNYTLINNSVRLQWQTSSEANTDKFEVEKSTDGINFNKIGTVASAGNSNTPRDYSFSDINPAAINYYRIKQIDKDGKAVYSKILNVKFKSGNPLTIQPTIVTNQLRVNIGLEQREIKGFQVYDISGKAILNFTGRSGYNEINVSSFSAGSYLIRLQTADGKAYSQRFVKQ